MAANYLPAITVTLPHAHAAMEMMKRTSALNRSTAASAEEQSIAAGAMHAGKTYAFHLSFTNPLYDPIQVRLKKAQTMLLPDAEGTASGNARRPPFMVTLPTSAFPVAAYAEAWEYEDDEDMFGLEDEDMDVDVDGRSRGNADGRSRSKTVGVLERRANVTVIGGEVILSKEARGNVKVDIFYKYLFPLLTIAYCSPVQHARVLYLPIG